MTNFVHLPISVDDVADSFAAQATPTQFFEFVAKMLDGFAMEEVDAELIARTWHKLKDCYGLDGEQLPTLGEMEQRFGLLDK